MKEHIPQLLIDYENDRTAVKKFAAKHGATVQAVYWHIKRMGFRLRSGGNASKGTQAREKNPNWKGGTTKRKDGYILEVRNGKQEFQHRLVAEELLGRPLERGECVHHKNGDKADNRPENIEVLPSHAEHMKQHCDSAVMRERGLRGLQKRYASIPPQRTAEP